MQKLHLVGVTTDQKGLILSARRGARSGSFHLSVDEDLAEAVEELRAKQAEVEAEQREEAEAARPSRVESALSVREIQARLRQGRSVTDVAKVAGVDPDWVERFAAPVFAERAQVISRVRSSSLRRARLGPSEHSIDESIRRNLADRGVAVSFEELAESWSARQLADGRWAVRFRYRHRNRDHHVRYDLDEASQEVVAADRASSQLGYITPTSPPPPSPPRPRPEPTVPPVVRRAPKRATVTVGFRPEDVAGTPTSRPAKERERASDAMRKAAVQAAAEAERAVARRAKEREAEAARREREARAEEARKARKAAAAERARVTAAKKKAAAAKKKAADRAKAKAEKQAADQARRAEAALRAAERREAARRKAAAQAVAAKKSAKTTAKKAGAKKTATKKHAKTTVKKQAPAKKTKKATPAQPARPSKAVSTPMRKAAPTAASTPRPAPPPASPMPRPAPEVQPVRPVPVPTAVPPPASVARDRAPAPVPEESTGDVRILGPVTSTVRVIPTFRTELVETAEAPRSRAEPSPGLGSSTPTPNGRAPERPAGERRTRPLRAT